MKKQCEPSCSGQWTQQLQTMEQTSMGKKTKKQIILREDISQVSLSRKRSPLRDIWKSLISECSFSELLSPQFWPKIDVWSKEINIHHDESLHVAMKLGNHKWKITTIFKTRISNWKRLLWQSKKKKKKRKISFRPVEAYLKGTLLRGLQWGGVLDVNSRHLF